MFSVKGVHYVQGDAWDIEDHVKAAIKELARDKFVVSNVIHINTDSDTASLYEDRFSVLLVYGHHLDG